MIEYEVEDYRKHKVPPKWLEWKPMSPFSYLMTLLIFVFIIPWTVGFSYGPIGILLNCIIIDYISYRGAIKQGEY